jgi:hypothetical protein
MLTNHTLDNKKDIYNEYCNNLLLNENIIIFGGYIRNSILGVCPSDIDIYIEHQEVSSSLWYLRHRLGLYIVGHKDNTKYGEVICVSYNTYFRGLIIKLDVVDSSLIKNLDFRCNGLATKKVGDKIITRSHPNITVEECMSDILNKRLICITPLIINREYRCGKIHLLADKYLLMRIKKMVLNGFTLQVDNIILSSANINDLVIEGDCTEHSIRKMFKCARCPMCVTSMSKFVTCNGKEVCKKCVPIDCVLCWTCGRQYHSSQHNTCYTCHQGMPDYTDFKELNRSNYKSKAKARLLRNSKK